MARITSKLQVTVPKAIAARYGIRPGTEVEWLPAGDAIRVVPTETPRRAANLSRRLALFDAATKRQRDRQVGQAPLHGDDRHWTRDELYQRGSPR
ncbi:MAG: AbrB/MazE/SpoVT family DNA-binding domain-containing protein [Candidatus Dormibacteria bacterium]